MVKKMRIMADGSFTKFSDQTTLHGNSAPLRHSSLIENYEVPGIVMNTGMVL